MAVIGSVEFDVRLNRENLDRQLAEIGRKAVDVKVNVVADGSAIAKHRKELERSFKKDFCVPFKFCDDSIRREKERVRKKFDDFCIPLKFCDDSIKTAKDLLRKEFGSVSINSKITQEVHIQSRASNLFRSNNSGITRSQLSSALHGNHYKLASSSVQNIVHGFKSALGSTTIKADTFGSVLKGNIFSGLLSGLTGQVSSSFSNSFETYFTKYFGNINSNIERGFNQFFRTLDIILDDLEFEKISSRIVSPAVAKQDDLKMRGKLKEQYQQKKAPEAQELARSIAIETAAKIEQLIATRRQQESKIEALTKERDEAFKRFVQARQGPKEEIAKAQSQYRKDLKAAGKDDKKISEAKTRYNAAISSIQSSISQDQKDKISELKDQVEDAVENLRKAVREPARIEKEIEILFKLVQETPEIPSNIKEGLLSYAQAYKKQVKDYQEEQLFAIKPADKTSDIKAAQSLLASLKKKELQLKTQEKSPEVQVDLEKTQAKIKGVQKKLNQLQIIQNLPSLIQELKKKEQDIQLKLENQIKESARLEKEINKTPFPSLSDVKPDKSNLKEVQSRFAKAKQVREDFNRSSQQSKSTLEELKATQGKLKNAEALFAKEQNNSLAEKTDDVNKSKDLLIRIKNEEKKERARLQKQIIAARKYQAASEKMPIPSPSELKPDKSNAEDYNAKVASSQLVRERYRQFSEASVKTRKKIALLQLAGKREEENLNRKKAVVYESMPIVERELGLSSQDLKNKQVEAAKSKALAVGGVKDVSKYKKMAEDFPVPDLSTLSQEQIDSPEIQAQLNYAKQVREKYVKASKEARARLEVSKKAQEELKKAEERFKKAKEQVKKQSKERVEVDNANLNNLYDIILGNIPKKPDKTSEIEKLGINIEKAVQSATETLEAKDSKKAKEIISQKHTKSTTKPPAAFLEIVEEISKITGETYSLQDIPSIAIDKRANKTEAFYVRKANEIKVSLELAGKLLKNIELSSEEVGTLAHEFIHGKQFDFGKVEGTADLASRNYKFLEPENKEEAASISNQVYLSTYKGLKDSTFSSDQRRKMEVDAYLFEKRYASTIAENIKRKKLRKQIEEKAGYRGQVLGLVPPESGGLSPQRLYEQQLPRFQELAQKHGLPENYKQIEKFLNPDAITSSVDDLKTAIFEGFEEDSADRLTQKLNVIKKFLAHIDNANKIISNYIDEFSVEREEVSERLPATEEVLQKPPLLKSLSVEDELEALKLEKLNLGTEDLSPVKLEIDKIQLQAIAKDLVRFIKAETIKQELKMLGIEPQGKKEDYARQLVSELGQHALQDIAKFASPEQLTKEGLSQIERIKLPRLDPEDFANLQKYLKDSVPDMSKNLSNIQSKIKTQDLKSVGASIDKSIEYFSGFLSSIEAIQKESFVPGKQNQVLTGYATYFKTSIEQLQSAKTEIESQGIESLDRIVLPDLSKLKIENNQSVSEDITRLARIDFEGDSILDTERAKGFLSVMWDRLRRDTKKATKVFQPEMQDINSLIEKTQKSVGENPRIQEIKRFSQDISSAFDVETIEKRLFENKLKLIENIPDLKGKSGEDIDKAIANLVSVLKDFTSIPSDLINEFQNNAIDGIIDDVKYRAKELQSELPDIMDAKFKSTIFTVGGFAGQGGASSFDKVAELSETFSDSLVMGVPNVELDSVIGAGENPGLWAAHVMETVVRDNLETGYHKDAKELAARMLAASQKYGTPISAVGHSGGGFIVQDALKILERMGHKDFTGATVGTPQFGFLSPGQKQKNLKTFGTSDDILTRIFSEGIIQVPGMSGGHSSEGYLKDPQVIDYLKQLFYKQLSEKAQIQYVKMLKESAKIAGYKIKDLAKIPEVEVDSEMLKEAGINALYDIKKNKIVISQEVADILNSTPEEIRKNYKQLESLIHEIQHSFQFDFGSIGLGDISMDGITTVNQQKISDKSQSMAQKNVSAMTEGTNVVEPTRKAMELVEADAYEFEKNTKEIINKSTSRTVREVASIYLQRFTEWGKKLTGGSEQLKESYENFFSKLQSFEDEIVNQFPKANFLKGFTEQFEELAGGVGVAGFAFLQIRALVPVLRDLTMISLEVAAQFQSMQIRLDVLGGSSEAGKKLFKNIRNEAIATSSDLQVATETYTQLVATTKNTELEGQATEKIQKALLQSGTFYGLNSEQLEGAMTAISQIAGKGVVSMEELRGQLSERLPGAFQIAARSMNMTTQEFGNLVATGQLAAVDFLPKFADQLLKETASGAEAAQKTAIAAQTRLKNAVTEFQAGFGKSIQPFQIVGLDALTKVLQEVSKHAGLLSRAMVSLIGIIGVRFISSILKINLAVKGVKLGFVALTNLIKFAVIPTLLSVGKSVFVWFSIESVIKSAISAYDTFFSKTKSATWSAQLQSDLKSSREELAKLRAEIDKASQPEPTKPRTAFSEARDELKEEQKNRTLAQRTGRFLFGGISDLINPNSDNRRLSKAANQTFKESRELKALEKDYEESLKPRLLDPVKDLTVDTQRIEQIKQTNEQIFRLRQQAALTEDIQEQDRIKKRIENLRKEQNILDSEYGDRLKTLDSQIAGREEALETAVGSEFREKLESEIKELKEARKGLAEAIEEFGGATDLSRLLQDLTRVRLEIETFNRVAQETESLKFTGIVKDQLDELRNNPLAGMSADLKRSEVGLENAIAKVNSAQGSIRDFNAILADPLIEQYVDKFNRLNLEELRQQLEGVDESDTERRIALEALIGLREQESELVELQRAEAEALLQLEQQRSQAALRRIQFEMEKRQIETQRIEVEDTTGLIGEQLGGRMKTGEAEVRRAEISSESSKRRQADIAKEIELVELAKRRGELTAEDYHQKMIALEGQRLGAVQQSAEQELALRQAKQSQILAALESSARKATAIAKQTENDRLIEIKQSLLNQEILSEQSEVQISQARAQGLQAERQNLQNQLADLTQHYRRKEIDQSEFNSRSLDLEQQLSDNKLQIIENQLQEQQAIQSRALMQIELDYQNHLARISGLESDRVVAVRQEQMRMVSVRSDAVEQAELKIAQIQKDTAISNFKATQEQLRDLQQSYRSGEITDPEFRTRERDLIKQLKADQVNLVNQEIGLRNQREQLILSGLDRENQAYEHSKRIREGNIAIDQKEFENLKAFNAVGLQEIRAFEDEQTLLAQQSSEDYIAELHRRIEALNNQYLSGTLSKKAYNERFKQLEQDLSAAVLAESDIRLQAQLRVNQRATEDFERHVRQRDVLRQIEAAKLDEAIKTQILQRSALVGFARAEEESAIASAVSQLQASKANFTEIKRQIKEVRELRASGVFSQIEEQQRLGDLEARLAQNKVEQIDRQIALEKAQIQERLNGIRRESERQSQHFEMVKTGLNTESQLRESRTKLLQQETAEFQKQKEILDQQIAIAQSLNNFANERAKGEVDRISRIQGYVDKIRDIQSKIRDQNTDKSELANLKQQLSTYKELAGLGEGTALVNESRLGQLIRDLQNQKGQEEANLINARLDQNKQQEAFENRQLERQQLLNELSSQSNLLAAKNAVIQAEIALNTAKQAENKARFNYLEAQVSGDPSKIAIAAQGIDIAQEGVKIAKMGIVNAEREVANQQRIADLQGEANQTARDKQFVDQQIRRQGLNIEAQATEERLTTEAVESLNRGSKREGLQTRFEIDRLNIDKQGLRGVRDRSESYFDRELSTPLSSAEDVLSRITQQFESSVQGLFGENIFQKLEQDALTRSLSRGVERAYQIQSGIQPGMDMRSQIQSTSMTPDNEVMSNAPPTGGQLNTIQGQLDKINETLMKSSSGVQNLTVVSNDPAGDSRQVMEDWTRYRNYGN